MKRWPVDYPRVFKSVLLLTLPSPEPDSLGKGSWMFSIAGRLTDSPSMRAVRRTGSLGEGEQWCIHIRVPLLTLRFTCWSRVGKQFEVRKYIYLHSSSPAYGRWSYRVISLLLALPISGEGCGDIGGRESYTLCFYGVKWSISPGVVAWRGWRLGLGGSEDVIGGA